MDVTKMQKETCWINYTLLMEIAGHAGTMENRMEVLPKLENIITV